MNKTTVYILIGIILTISLSVAIFYKDDFNYIDLSNSTNKIENYSSHSYVDTLTHLSLKFLGVDSVRVTILDADKHNLSNVIKNIDSKAFVIKDPDTGDYIIYLSKYISKDEMIEIIAHESAHIWQYNSKLLEAPKSPLVIWKGDSLNSDTIDYNMRPWERDAFKIQKTLSDSLREILY